MHDRSKPSIRAHPIRTYTRRRKQPENGADGSNLKMVMYTVHAWLFYWSEEQSMEIWRHCRKVRRIRYTVFRLAWLSVTSVESEECWAIRVTTSSYDGEPQVVELTLEAAQGTTELGKEASGFASLRRKRAHVAVGRSIEKALQIRVFRGASQASSDHGLQLFPEEAPDGDVRGSQELEHVTHSLQFQLVRHWQQSQTSQLQRTIQVVLTGVLGQVADLPG